VRVTANRAASGTANAIEQAVLACFTAYEEALSAGDVVAMDSWFAEETRTIRFGIADEQWGAEEVRHWRAVAPRVPAGRSLSKTRVDLWADNLALVTTLFRYPASVSDGRQSQIWLRTDAGWRIIHAHVSERPLRP
jgi:ketosteroid isomerase-like protein